MDTRITTCAGIIAACAFLAPVAAFASRKDAPFVTSEDIYGTGYLRREVRFVGLVKDAFRDEVDPAIMFIVAKDDHGEVFIAVKTGEVPPWTADDLIDCLNRYEYTFTEQDCINERCHDQILTLDGMWNNSRWTWPPEHPTRIFHFAGTPDWFEREPLVQNYKGDLLL